jgi:hypothetical protein
LLLNALRKLTWINQEYDGALSFTTDAWMSPNYKAYIAVSVHFEQDGVPVSMLLDIVEVARSHSGLNLAAAFAKILDDFGISNKVNKPLPAVNGMTAHCEHEDPFDHL